MRLIRYPRHLDRIATSTHRYYYALVWNAFDSLHRKDPSSYVAFTQKMYSMSGRSPVLLKRVCNPWYTSLTTPVVVASMSLNLLIRSAFLVGGRHATSMELGVHTASSIRSKVSMVMLPFLLSFFILSMSSGSVNSKVCSSSSLSSLQNFSAFQTCKVSWQGVYDVDLPSKHRATIQHSHEP